MQKRNIYIFFGLIASGKSTLAQAFAESRDYLYYNTDLVRKELAGLEATERRTDGLEQGIYTREFTVKTYQTMLDRAAGDLNSGNCGVVLDGSYARFADRRSVLDRANSLNGKAVFVLCSCSEQEVERRLAIRAGDPNAVSDGRWDIYVNQKKTFEQPDELSGDQLLKINTEQDVATMLKLLGNSFHLSRSLKNAEPQS